MGPTTECQHMGVRPHHSGVDASRFARSSSVPSVPSWSSERAIGRAAVRTRPQPPNRGRVRSRHGSPTRIARPAVSRPTFSIGCSTITSAVHVDAARAFQCCPPGRRWVRIPGGARRSGAHIRPRQRTTSQGLATCRSAVRTRRRQTGRGACPCANCGRRPIARPVR